MVYPIKCQFWNKAYIGETARRLKTRISEHKRYCKLGNHNSFVTTLLALSGKKIKDENVKYHSNLLKHFIMVMSFN